MNTKFRLSFSFGVAHPSMIAKKHVFNLSQQGKSIQFI